MPTYTYECKNCFHQFEEFQSMKDEPLNICPKCGKNVKRIINSGTGIIFKGAGFYINDSKKGTSSEPSKKSVSE